MIVKNEDHIIEKTLKNILEYIKIDYYIICDTGSNDNTIKNIKDFFNNERISGEIYETPWENFGKNRTIALEKAYKKTDYLLIFDADDKINGKFTLPNILHADKYEFKLGSKDFFYKRPLLINNNKRWKFKGVLHEYLENIDEINKTVFIDGDYYIESGKEGNRNKNINKYYNDAKILEIAYKNEEEIFLKNRYAFYIAQSYKDCGEIDKAILWYKKVLTLNNWEQEKYYSCLMVGDLYKRQNLIDNANSYYFKTVEYDKSRIEGIVNLCKYYYEKENHLLVHLLCNKFNNNYIDYDKKLFIDLNVYNDELDYYNSISSYYINEKENGYKSLKKVLINKKVNDIKYEYSIKNIKFYKDLMENDIEGDILNEKVNKYFENKNLDLLKKYN